MAYTVAIANQKGGVGKTTTAVNLAASLAVAEQRVLLVDMDPQCNASSGVGLRAEPGEATSYSLLHTENNAEETLQSTELSHLDVIRSTPDLAAVELEFVDVPDRATRLRDALATVSHRYDYVLIDCPPSLGMLTINALVAADAVLVPMQCEYYAMEGLSQLVDTIERIRASLNPELKVDGVLLTMYDPRSNLSSQVAEELRKHFPVYNTVIPRNIRLAEAPSHGKPIVLYDAASKGSHGYLNLAREILASPPQAAA